MMTLCINDYHWSGQYSYLGTTRTLGECLDPSSPCEGSGSETRKKVVANSVQAMA